MYKRQEHYREIGLSQIAYCDHLKKYPNKPFNPKDYNLKVSNLSCPSMDYDAVDVRSLSTHISPEDILNKYVPCLLYTSTRFLLYDIM